jgi:hypothetical protein
LTVTVDELVAALSVGRMTELHTPPCMHGERETQGSYGAITTSCTDARIVIGIVTVQDGCAPCALRCAVFESTMVAVIVYAPGRRSALAAASKVSVLVVESSVIVELMLASVVDQL